MDFHERLDGFMTQSGFPEGAQEAVRHEIEVSPMLSAEATLRVLQIGRTAFVEAHRRADASLDTRPINWDDFTPNRVDL